MKKCPSCNRTYEDSVRFCIGCGSPLQQIAVAAVCVKCGLSLQPGTRFCVNCGTPVTSAAPTAGKCVKCGMTLQPGVKFCVGCGTPVAPAPQPAPAPVPQPAPAPAPQPAPAPAKKDLPKKDEVKKTDVKKTEIKKNDKASAPAKKSGKGLLIGIIAGGVALVAAVVVLLVLFVFGGPGNPLDPFMKKGAKYETITDARDQQRYKTIQVGNQVWMAQNLNFASPNSKCDSCSLFGRSYTWNEALNSCPAGFVLPSMKDYEVLMAAVGTDANAWRSALGWNGKVGTDKAGLSVIPAGYYSSKGEGFKRRGDMTGFWTRSADGEYAMRLKLDVDKETVNLSGLNKNIGYSIRCISQGSSLNDDFSFVVDSRTNQPIKTVQIGDQIWLAGNMNYKSSKMTKNYCYDDNEANCEKYGRLYEWNDAILVCPEGTRLPNTKDFEKLKKYLKTSGRSDEFAPVMPGFRNAKGGYELIDARADYWSSSDVSGVGKYWFISTSKPGELSTSKFSKKAAMTVRCLKDSLTFDYSTDTFTDVRDGRTYVTVKIGKQTWIAENMKYVTSNSYCYKNVNSNCEIYGRLYNWAEAYDACPSGYHLPDDEDWSKLKNYISDNGDGKLASMLKSSDYWKTPGRDVTGMDIRPSGYRNEDGKFDRLGERAYMWSASMKNWDSAYHWSVVEGSEYFGKTTVYKENLRAVRCVRNF